MAATLYSRLKEAEIPLRKFWEEENILDFNLRELAELCGYREL